MSDSIYSNSGLHGSEALKDFKERPYRLRKGARWIARILGIVTLLSALFGIAYSATSLSFVRSDADREYRLPHFDAAFYAMSAICIVCYVALLWCGYQLIRLRLNVSGLLIGIWLSEIAYFLLVRFCGSVPGVGKSIAGATGVANGGLMVQFLILLPIWGPLAILLLKRLQISPSGPVAA